MAGKIFQIPRDFPYQPAAILQQVQDERIEYLMPPPYRRLRRTVFLQVAVQVRLCRARYL